MISIGNAGAAWRSPYASFSTERSESGKFSSTSDSTQKHGSEAYYHLPISQDTEHGSVNIEA
jgi:hypothetical protein